MLSLPIQFEIYTYRWQYFGCIQVGQRAAGNARQMYHYLGPRSVAMQLESVNRDHRYLLLSLRRNFSSARKNEDETTRPHEEPRANKKRNEGEYYLGGGLCANTIQLLLNETRTAITTITLARGCDECRVSLRIRLIIFSSIHEEFPPTLAQVVSYATLDWKRAGTAPRRVVFLRLFYDLAFRVSWTLVPGVYTFTHSLHLGMRVTRGRADSNIVTRHDCTIRIEFYILYRAVRSNAG